MEWYVGRNGQTFGPMVFGDLAQAARQGQLTEDDFVWCAGMAEWAPASSVSQLWDASDRGDGSRAQRPGRLPATLKQLLVPRGRTNRAFFWGTLSLALAGTFGTANVLAITVPTTELLAWPAAFVAMFYLFTSLVIGRLHDHNQGWWLAIFYVVLAGLLLAIFSFGPTDDPLSGTGTVARACTFVACFAMVVHLGLMRGTVGSNRFGPDLVTDAHPEDYFSDARLQTLFMPGPGRTIAVLAAIWATLRGFAQMVKAARLVSMMKRAEERHWEGIKRNLELAERMRWHQVTRFHSKRVIDPRLHSPTIGSLLSELIVGILLTGAFTTFFSLILIIVFAPELKRIHEYNATFEPVGLVAIAFAISVVLIVMRIRKAKSHR